MSSDDQLGSSFHVKTHVCYRGGLTGARIEERTQSFRSKMEHFFYIFRRLCLICHSFRRI